jgi:hypothetical protein
MAEAFQTVFAQIHKEEGSSAQKPEVTKAFNSILSADSQKRRQFCAKPRG